MSKALLEYKIIPRLMIFTMTVVYVRCIEWALSQPDLSTQQASLISVVTGAMTGIASRVSKLGDKEMIQALIGPVTGLLDKFIEDKDQKK
jgi:hypothetical protein